MKGEPYGGELVQGDHYCGSQGSARTRKVAKYVIVMKFLAFFAGIYGDGMERCELVATVEEIVV